MRKLNTHVRVTNKYIKEQFEEIDNENLKDRFVYGILSDSIPNKKDSPFSVNVSVQKVSISIAIRENYYHVGDTISFSALDNNNKGVNIILKEGVEEGDNWSYGSTAKESLRNLCDAINAIHNTNVQAYLVDDGDRIVLYGALSDAPFNVINGNKEGKSNNCISLAQNISIEVKGGEVVFPNGNYAKFENSTVTFPAIYLNTNDIIMLCLKYNEVEDKLGENEFGEKVAKSIKAVTSITFENNYLNIDENSVCIAIIKSYDNSIHIVDEEGHKYPYNRPWFSPKDIEHQCTVGSAKITEHNPHGIDYDDIDSDNTLHNRMLNDGLVISKPKYLQDIPGLFIVENLSAESIIPDVDGTMSYYSTGSNTRYYCLKYKPTCVHKILKNNNDGTKVEVFLKWIEDTPYLLCDENFSYDITIYYSYSPTAQPVIEKTQGVLLNPLYDKDVMFSEGKNVRKFNTTVDIFHKTSINRYFFVNIDKNGNIETNPKVLVNNGLDIESEETSSIKERSRLVAFLYNTKCNNELSSPTTAVKYKNNKELNLFKTNTSYSVKMSGDDKEYNLYLDSFTSPGYNKFEECKEDEEYIVIDTSDDYCNGTRISNSLHCLKDTIDKDNVGRYSGSYSMDINLKKHLVTHISGYIVVTGASSYVSASLFANNTNLVNVSSSDTGVTYLKIDEDLPSNTIETGKYILNIQSTGSFYVQEIHLELDYDEVRCRYYITQDEGDEKNVTRVLYDSTFSYVIYGYSPVIVEGYLIKIKKSYILYDHLSDNTTIPDGFFPKVSLKTNAGFNVEATVFGESNDGESVSETITFDDTFREQYGLNYKILDNAFSQVSKYTVNASNTEGNILILSYPLSNYLNPFRIMYANYESNKMKNYNDLRLCVTSIQSSKDYSREFIAKTCDIDIE